MATRSRFAEATPVAGAVTSPPGVIVGPVILGPVILGPVILAA